MRKKKMIFFIMLMCLVLLSYGLVYLEKNIRPVFLDIAEAKIKSMMSRTANEAIKEKFAEDLDYNDFLIIGKDDEGNITMVQSNVVSMNRMSSELAIAIQDKLKNKEHSEVEISLGSVFNSQVMAQVGPMINLKVLPLGTAKVNFKTEFENVGINQTRYKIFLEVDTQAKIIIPFSPHTISVKTNVPVAETVIVGKVPQSYVYIPEKNVPNILNNLNDIVQ